MHEPQIKISYRPEIDGLRAIAVLAVIVYHAEVVLFGHSLFQGGFIGVDVFFVISGYLITSLILKELVTTGKFSFYHFYERRIRRIMPVLLLVILASIVCAWFFLVPISFLEFSRSILYALGFSSNFYFHYSGLQYGAEGGQYLPLLHTWSLSVEEQYYLLFPIFLCFAFKHFRKQLLIILFSGFLVSLLIADWGSRTHPSFNFYVLPTRVWEMLAGSLLAYFEVNRGRRDVNRTVSQILPTVGLVLIGHAFVFYNDRMFHPSLYTLSPIIGVCLYIWFSGKGDIATRILSSRLFVKIGLISYSLYLWHYPVFVFARTSEFISGNDVFKKTVLVILTFILSAFSYYLEEQHYRNVKYKFTEILGTLSLIASVILSFSAASMFTFGFEELRVPQELRKQHYDDRYAHQELTDRCHNDESLQEYCKFGAFANNVYLVGDSHMISIAFDLRNKLNALEYNLTTMTHGGALYGRFAAIDDKRNAVLADVKNSVVVFGGYIHRENPSSLSDFKKLYGSTFDKLLKNNNRIVLIYPVPSVDMKYSMNLVRDLKRTGKLEDKFAKKSAFENESKLAYEFYDSFQNENIFRVYPEKHSCDESKCYAVKDNVIYISDFDHPSKHLSDRINADIVRFVKNTVH